MCDSATNASLLTLNASGYILNMILKPFSCQTREFQIGHYSWNIKMQVYFCTCNRDTFAVWCRRKLLLRSLVIHKPGFARTFFSFFIVPQRRPINFPQRSLPLINLLPECIRYCLETDRQIFLQRLVMVEWVMLWYKRLLKVAFVILLHNIGIYIGNTGLRKSISGTV